MLRTGQQASREGSSRGGKQDGWVPTIEIPSRDRAATGEGGGGADCHRYLETLFREYLTYRGLTSTLAAFTQELATEPTAGFRADALCDLLFQRLIPAGNLTCLLDTMDFLRSRFYSRLPSQQHEATIRQMECSLLRLYIATHWRAGRTDLVSTFFTTAGQRLLQGPDADDWRGWFAIPHVPSVTSEPHMKVFFTQEWADLAEMSFRNFMGKVFASMPLPAVLGFNKLRQKRKELQRQVEILEEENTALRRLLADADRAREEGDGCPASRAGALTTSRKGGDEDGGGDSPERDTSIAQDVMEASDSGGMLSHPIMSPNDPTFESVQMGMRAEESEGHGNGEGLPTAEDASVLERLEGHRAPITVCRFSPGGQHVASGASDGAVRIWAPACTSGAQPASDTRAASFQAGGPILSLDWDRRANKIMLVGTSMAGIKAWHLDTCRIVGEVRPQTMLETMGHVLALAASPTEAVFAASMATSATAGWQAAGRLTLWNMRTFLKAATLTLDPLSAGTLTSADSSAAAAEDTAVASLDFSRDGRLLGAGCSDGSVRLFDMSAGGGRAQVMAWTASRSGGCSSIRFSDDGRSVMTLAGEGILQEWALAKGPRGSSGSGSGSKRGGGSTVLLSSCEVGTHCSTHLGGAQSRSHLRHHFAVSPDARSVALTSSDGRLPILTREREGWSLAARPSLHPRSISAVDWHPSMNIVASGSDHRLVTLSCGTDRAAGESRD